VSGPLSGIKVLDLSRVLAGPWASQLLADYGADVTKVERPGSGDDTRLWGPPWLADSNGRSTTESAYFLSANRNKRSVTADLAKDGGQALVRDLARISDILIENFRAGTLVRYGLDAHSLRELNPRLIYCSISAYGQTGSRRLRPGAGPLFRRRPSLARSPRQQLRSTLLPRQACPGSNRCPMRRPSRGRRRSPAANSRPSPTSPRR